MSNCKHENRTIDCVCNDCGYDLIVDPMAEKYAALERERIIKLLEQTDQLVFMNDGYADNMADTVIALIKGENK